MKKLFFMAALTACVFTFSSCNNDELPDSQPKVDGTELKIQTQVTSIDAVSTRATPLSAFLPNANIGLFVTSGSLGNNYDSYVFNANVRSIFSGSSWAQTPVVRLTGENATVYAYYPYNSSNTDGKSVKVDNAAQQDFMYGTHTAGQAAINKNNPTVNLTMKHALAMVQFNICKANYPWPGKLTRIEIANETDKSILYSEGTMDISTGVITNTAGKNNAASLGAFSDSFPLMTITEKLLSDEAAFLKLFVLPLNSTGAEGDVVFKFTIDERIYTWKVPANTVWKSGTKNTYTVTVTGSALNIGNVNITDWTGGVTGNVGLAD